MSDQEKSASEQKDEKKSPDKRSTEPVNEKTAAEFEAFREKHADSIQSLIESTFTTRLAAIEKRHQRELAEAEERIKADTKRKAEEAKLIEDGKDKEYAELMAKRAAEAEAKLTTMERQIHITQLLDKQKVMEPAVRDLFMSLPGELTEINTKLESFQGVVNALVEKQVAERLASGAPPKGAVGNALTLADLDNDTKKAEFIKTHGLASYREILDRDSKKKLNAARAG